MCSGSHRAHHPARWIQKRVNGTIGGPSVRRVSQKGEISTRHLIDRGRDRKSRSIRCLFERGSDIERQSGDCEGDFWMMSSKPLALLRSTAVNLEGQRT